MVRWVLAGILAFGLLVSVLVNSSVGKQPSPESFCAKRTTHPNCVMPSPSPTPTPTPSPSPTPEPSPTPSESPTPEPSPSPSPEPTPTPEPDDNRYVSASGSDANPGTFDQPWRTLNHDLTGRTVLLRRGDTFGPQTVDDNGATIGAYGTGADPIITGGSTCLTLPGNDNTIGGLRLDSCTWAGLSITGDRNLIQGNYITGNAAGIFVKTGAEDTRILNNRIIRNDRMSQLTEGGDDDSGAFGVLLHGDRTEVAYNDIAEHDAFSYDYGRDGAAVEIYGERDGHIHHNRTWDNHTFAETGNSRSARNTFAFNLVVSDLPNSSFFITRGGDSHWGPVLDSRLINNTVIMRASGTQGFVCHGGCGPDILTMRNNIIVAQWKAGFADAAFDGDFNIYQGQRQFSLGPNDIVADPGLDANHRPLPGSPAIDSGAATSYQVDLDGEPVGTADRGCFAA